jgi:site-specific recombinase XerD
MKSSVISRINKLPLVILAAVGGAILGDNLGFWVGREGGFRLLRRYGRYIRLDERKLKLGVYLFRRHGGKVVFFGRFVAVLRAWAAFLAGIARMRWLAFLPEIHPFFSQDAGIWIAVYAEEVLATKDEATIEAYIRILEKFAGWLSLRPGNSGQFRQEAITRTAIEGFLETLPSFSDKQQARVALSVFRRWLQEDQQLLSRKPVRGVAIPAQALLAPRELSEDQRYVIRDPVEREADVRGKAAFAPGYFAGCRVSDVSWLLLDQTQVSGKAGRMTVGHKGGKERTIDQVNEARSPLYDYLHQGERKGSACIFTSQRVKKHVSAEEIDGCRWSCTASNKLAG